MFPKISIITITFNAERYLAQTMDSVAGQQYPDLEYIIVDGGSTDATLAIVKSRGGLVTKLISEPDNGISDAFNKGIRLATGEIIGIINADDYYHQGALDAVAQVVQEHPDDDVYYGNAIHERFDGSGAFHFRPAREIDRHIWRRMPISHPATFVRRTAYERFGHFETRYRLAMDYDLVLRMYRNGARFRYVDAVLSHFRYGQDRGFSGLRELRDIAVVHGLSPFTAHALFYITCFKAQTKRLIPNFLAN
jgi:glycosyltransferase involved in cell wall biosynthesis